MTPETSPVREAGQDFIRDIVTDDIAAGRHKAPTRMLRASLRPFGLPPSC